MAWIKQWQIDKLKELGEVCIGYAYLFKNRKGEINQYLMREARGRGFKIEARYRENRFIKEELLYLMKEEKS